jgi:hypothetical protein
MVELALLLPARQAEGLEDRARAQGLTPGQLLRRLIQDYLTCPYDPDRGVRLRPGERFRDRCEDVP